MESDYIWMDGKLVPWADAKVHVLTHALHYGYGVFEGIRCYETHDGRSAVFRLDEHMRRLVRSAKILMIESPFSADELVEATVETIRANNLTQCYIRPLVYSGYGQMGLNPTGIDIQTAIAVWPWGAYLGDDGIRHGIRTKTSSWQRLEHNTHPPMAKTTGNYVNSILAKMEVVRAGYDEAILLNGQGFVAEGSGENIFVIRDGVIFTPPLESGALEGLTRDTIIELAKDLGYELHERNVVRGDLYICDEAFFTGTAAEVVPIREIDDRPIGEPGPITKELQALYYGIVHGEVEQYAHWLHYV
jgi:branched-chain amino acid aminotransferase